MPMQFLRRGIGHFNPRAIRKAKLQGHHRVPGGAWIPWKPGPREVLQSVVLGLTLVVGGLYLRLQGAEGHWVLSKTEAAARELAEQRAAAAEAALARLQG